MVLYFAYGSNINVKQMKQRCPSTEFYSHATLKGYKLVFPRQSARWSGGVAGIEPSSKEYVEGVVYSISTEDLKRLDDFEGVPDGRYYRKKIRVTLADGKEIDTWIYFASPEGIGDFLPSRKYIETIIEGAKEHHFPKASIKKLHSLLVKTASVKKG